MFDSSTLHARLAPSLWLVALLAAGAAQAGECPAGKSGPNALAGAPTAAVGVTDTELAAIDLAAENVGLDQRRLRLRHMTIGDIANDSKPDTMAQHM